MTALEFARTGDWGQTAQSRASRARPRLARIWRMALWFNWIWPGSLTPEANGVWRIHGPQGRRRWRWRLVMGLARLGAWSWPPALSPGRWGLACRPKPVLLIWWFGSSRRRLARRPLGDRPARRARRKWYAFAALAVLAGVAALAAPQIFHRHPGAVARFDRLGLIPRLYGGGGAGSTGSGSTGATGAFGPGGVRQAPRILPISTLSNLDFGDRGPGLGTGFADFPGGSLSPSSETSPGPSQAGDPASNGGSADGGGGTGGGGGGGGSGGGGGGGAPQTSQTPSDPSDPTTPGTTTPTPVVFNPPGPSDPPKTTPDDGGVVFVQDPTPDPLSPPLHSSSPGDGTQGDPTIDNPPKTLDSPAAVPEPAGWAMLIAGFAAMGIALRRRRDRAYATASVVDASRRLGR